MRKIILRNLKENIVCITGVLPHFRILEQLKQSDEKEVNSRSPYFIWEDSESSNKRVDRSIGLSESFHEIIQFLSSVFRWGSPFLLVSLDIICLQSTVVQS